ncbi:hypothetical protein UVI_02055640 [Ustilaginoidea virens]|uniref:Sensitive to high expression protein 9, mitochondrial n=1 Tax=Ustilaginoidea virens TaxID=1159556 RepID=A0A1B5KYA5_USTVR|nr:hypothetical protein UVI_02055640 [Ustilaginoidea virens]
MQPLRGSMARRAWNGTQRMLLQQSPTALASRANQRPTSWENRTHLYQGGRRNQTSQWRPISSHHQPKDSHASSGFAGDANSAFEVGKAPPVSQLQASATELPSVAEGRRSDLNQRFSQVMDNVQARVLTASQTLNDITGYSAIEAIKKENEALEMQLSEAHAKVRSVRQAYKTSNTKRATTQREVTTLLARKDTWSPVDLERFTELYRIDHVLEGEVSAAQESLTEAEAEEQSLSQRLNAGILKRYHEEQIWSDRIRRASTWGTWGLMGMNFLLFVVLQFFAEPWRRKRLVKGVAEEEKRVLDQVRNELELVRATLAKQERSFPEVETEALAGKPADPDVTSPAPPGVAWRDIVMEPARLKTAAADLCSERKIDLRMKDASALVLQGALAGAAVAGSIAMFLLRKT